MNINEIKKSEVWWNDPDHECSRLLKIKKIECKGEFLHITEDDGSELEVLPEELSFKPF